jgi:protein SCO1
MGFGPATENNVLIMLKIFLHICLTLLCFLSAGNTLASDADAPHNGAAIYLANLPLVDQHGKTVDLYPDLVKGHTIVLHSFFARCEGSCPVMMATLQGLQKRLGDELGKTVHIVSITVDPAHDTPEVLAAYAKRVQAGPGWHFLSGTPEQVNLALRRIGQYADAPENHMNLMIVGNDSTGDWRKLHALAPARDLLEEILAVVDGKADDKGDAAAQSP